MDASKRDQAAGVRCVVLGASGFIGAHLTADLLSAGHRVRVLSRSGEHRFPPGVEVVPGDATDTEALRAVVRDADVVFHLIHSLSERDFAERDRLIAAGLCAAAAEAGVGQIVYLSGPRPIGRTSPHLASRSEVADILLSGEVPAAILQASLIVGEGSTGIEVLARIARLPVVPCPAWMRHRSRPVALADVRHYLRAVVDAVPVRGRLDLSGPEPVTYRELVRRCARVLRRPVPVMPPAVLWSHSLAARATELFTPVSKGVAAPLFASLEHDLLPVDTAAETILPHPPGGSPTLDNALREALSSPVRPPSEGPAHYGKHTLRTPVSADRVWQSIVGLGGHRQPFAPATAWALRGLLDQLIGGAGLYRGRPEHLRPGDVVDFWTVRSRDDQRRELVLTADMQLPGTVELTLRAEPAQDGTAFEQTVRFTPAGTLGTAYWYLQKPLHDLVFAQLARSIVDTAEHSRAGQSV
ncbi:DUF2867 domain-containing protein [Amycolatopsis sp. PS_44_ISF1]|uniref:DUF2867 domain-containing protein n=1 Tax=Amycolatopsis sp. PS_44_ISF1 TaxID=2974917 RepID=UPI0028E066EF|nr:DUF2867 domain-containing protein [Amycolatopsis sp. PS_44_ISF1]MDT8914950.1 SDR family oxidoreductase [Amycolatopsis sp. PS_44_ISF1]